MSTGVPIKVTPGLHAASHGDGGTDEVTVENLAATSTDNTQVFGPDGSGGVEAKGVTDSAAIHDDAAGEILAITLKAAPGGTDVLVLEDVAAANVKKRTTAAAIAASGPPAAHALGGSEHSSSTLAQVNALVSDATLDTSSASRPPSGAAGGDLGGTYPNPTVDDGADGTAIHDNVNSEISALTDKAVPVGGDFLIIEDSAASNAKKRISISNLPASVPVFGSEYNIVKFSTEISTTGTTPAAAIRLPSSGDITLPAGAYRLTLSYISRTTDSGQGTWIRLDQNGLILPAGGDYRTSNSNFNSSYTLIMELDLSAGDYNWDVEYFCSIGGEDSKLSDMSLGIFRVS